MKRLPAEIIDLFKRWGLVEVYEVVQQTDEIQLVLKDTRFGAGVVTVTPKGEYILLRHSYDLPGITRSDWNPPGGKVEENESFEEAAVREAYEETGCKVHLTGLYKVFHIHQMSREEKRGEWYMVMFRGLTESVPVNHTNPEVAEIKLFRELPSSFAGDLNIYYRDLY
jgi:8-oxo-dGTP pyrophosphatase MutT (NUDIX family)